MLTYTKWLLLSFEIIRIMNFDPCYLIQLEMKFVKESIFLHFILKFDTKLELFTLVYDEYQEDSLVSTYGIANIVI